MLNLTKFKVVLISDSQLIYCYIFPICHKNIDINILQ
jgi:hypothetical protein